MMSKISGYESKVKMCDYWRKGACANRGGCSYVHAWIDPRKSGVCQFAQNKKCVNTAETCQYQHLPITVKEYEALADGTHDYAELKKKVERRARRDWNSLVADLDEKAKEISYHKKVLQCTEWANGQCTKKICPFVHAWVQPGKKGVCQFYLQGECPDLSCQYQHLDMRLEEYERLSCDTRSFEEVLKKLGEENYDKVDARRAAPNVNDFKMVTCSYWSVGRCHNGKNCTFLHAWGNPEKKGLCMNYFKGRCSYTDESCYYQHCSIPIEQYERLAEGTRSYGELCHKIERIQGQSYNQNQTRMSQGLSHFDHAPIYDNGDQEVVNVSEANSQQQQQQQQQQPQQQQQQQQATPSAMARSFLWGVPFTKPVIAVDDPSHSLKSEAPKRNAVGEETKITDKLVNEDFELDDEKIPDDLRCPISLEMMTDPVSTKTGITYERKNIEAWLLRHDYDPVSRKILASKELIPNQFVKSRVLELKSKAVRNGISRFNDLGSRPSSLAESVRSHSDSEDNDKGEGKSSISSPALIKEEKKEAKKEDQESLLTFHDTSSEPAAKEEKLNSGKASWEQKPMGEWSVEEVSTFIRMRGNAPCWAKYATLFQDEEVDGPTLQQYAGDLVALTEDFKEIRRSHARNIVGGIQDILNINLQQFSSG